MSRIPFFVKASCFLIRLNLFIVQSYDKDEVVAVLNQTIDLSEELWPYKRIELMLERIEENLVYHYNNTWTLDIKAAFQIFLTKLNLKLTLEHPRMKLWFKNQYQPMTKERMDDIIHGAADLNYLFRYRVLARVPRVNQTRLISGLFAFTEEPWFRFLPPLGINHDADMLQLNKLINHKFKRMTFPTAAPLSEYQKDVMLEDESSKNSLYITQICLEEITRIAVNYTLMQRTAANETIPPIECTFPKKKQKACKEFVERGFFNKTSGYEIFFRLAIVTAARLARNCFIFNPTKDSTIVNYLCLMARLEMDRLDPETFEAPPNYYEGDSLTRHDFANLCLLNGFKTFLDHKFSECGNPNRTTAWNETGCYAKIGATIPKLTAPPIWTIVRPSPTEDGCYGRLTASCLAHQSFLIRGLVELGYIPKPRRKPTLPPGVTSTTPAVTVDDY